MVLAVLRPLGAARWGRRVALMRPLPLFEEAEPELQSAPEQNIPARVYRNEILRLPTRGERAEALARIADPRLRATVRFYVEDYFARLKYRRLPDFSTILREELI